MPPVEDVRATVRTVPVDAPGGVESDGTLEWTSTTVVFVEVDAGGVTGLGWTYGDAAAAGVVTGTLSCALAGREAMDVPACWQAMRAAVRNDGAAGIAALALSALDIALWDRAARQLGRPLAELLGAFRDAVPVYGSGGFCSYDDGRLAAQLGGWAADGLRMVKMKVGRDPDRDPARVAVAREAIGPEVQLFVDANGAWERREAVHRAHELDRAGGGIRWLEEPVSEQDPDGLRFVRDHVPPHVAVASGEYLWAPAGALALLRAGAVDVLQADVTRCGGMTGFRAIGALAAAHGVALSAHCAPVLNLHAACAVERLAHLEYFHDHVRIEHELLDGVPSPLDGALRVDRGRPGHGAVLRDAGERPTAPG